MSAELQKVLSRWIELMPMIAVASFTLSTEALHVRQPFRLVGVALRGSSATDEGLVAADDDHDEQVARSSPRRSAPSTASMMTVSFSLAGRRAVSGVTFVADAG